MKTIIVMFALVAIVIVAGVLIHQSNEAAYKQALDDFHQTAADTLSRLDAQKT